VSLLGSTQGGAERVWAVVNLLAQFPEGLSRDAAIGWLNPDVKRSDGSTRSAASAVGQAISAARSLSFIDQSDKMLSLRGPAPATFDAFSDVVHERLGRFAPEDADAVLFDALAWLILRCEQEKSFGWISTIGRKAMADAINASLPPRAASDTEDPRFNDTKIPFWFRWLQSVHVMTELSGEQWYPYLPERLWRALVASDLPRGEEIDGATLIAAINSRLPYLDGGRLWAATAARMSYTPPPTLSRVLSVALRDLHDDKRIQLSAVGDQTGLTYLAPDRRHRLQSFSMVKLAEVASDA
jgi:hypothetical protein